MSISLLVNKSSFMVLAVESSFCHLKDFYYALIFNEFEQISREMKEYFMRKIYSYVPTSTRLVIIIIFGRNTSFHITG